LLEYDVEEGIKGGAWYALGKSADPIAEVVGVLYLLWVYVID
jgi:hypothetical protein